MAFGLNPYVSYPGTAREAMTFYHSVLGGQLSMATFGEFQAAEPGSPDAEKIMHSFLKTAAGQELMASDTPPGMPAREGSRVQLAITAVGATEADEAQAKAWFDALADGGEVLQPLEKQIWGDTYGSLRDKFGVEWMFNVGAGPDQS